MPSTLDTALHQNFNDAAQGTVWHIPNHSLLSRCLEFQDITNNIKQILSGGFEYVYIATSDWPSLGVLQPLVCMIIISSLNMNFILKKNSNK